jgi:hypothetical protein
VKTGEIYGRMTDRNCIIVRQRKVYDWVERFQGGREIVDDYDARSAGTSTVTRVEFKEDIYKRIRDNLRISNDETASEISVTYGKKLCKYGLRGKRKYFILMELGNFLSDRSVDQNFEKQGDYIDTKRHD